MNLYKKILLIVVLFGVFGLGYWLGGENKFCPVCPPEEVNFSIMWEAWQKLKENYVNPGNLSERDMVYGATAGMVKAAGDPYTVFFNPEETTKFLEDVTGEFQGVGMEIGIKEDQLQVVSPIKGTPAEKAGLRPGDKILKIGETVAADISVEEAVSLIRGPKGTDVVLTIIRSEWQDPKDITIRRDVIKIPSMEWELIEEDVAHVKIFHFSEILGLDFRKAVAEIIASPAKKMIVDLRGNPGGYLEVSQEIAGWFLERGKTVVIEDFGNNIEKTIYKSEGNPRFANYPIVVLVNRGTASASEILAAALRDNRQDV
ncbi:MAG: S41 family peptidase, partial [bacterium]|nr:S41 family peptidase [bacterium]